MKELILENPPRKKGRKKTRSAAQRRATAKMLAANRARRSGKRKSTKRRRFKRPTPQSIGRRYARRRKLSSTMSTRKTSSRRRRKAHSRRRKTHTYLVRGTASPIKLNGMIGSIFSRDNLTVAGGAVAATVVTNYALGTSLAAKLPGNDNPYVRAGYMLLVPVLGGLVTKRFSPNLAKGMVIGGLANGIAQLLTAAKVGPAGIAVATVTTSAPALAAGTTATGEYLGEYLGASVGDRYGSLGGFPDSAWN